MWKMGNRNEKGRYWDRELFFLAFTDNHLSSFTTVWCNMIARNNLKTNKQNERLIQYYTNEKMTSIKINV